MRRMLGDATTDDKIDLALIRGESAAAQAVYNEVVETLRRMVKKADALNIFKIRTFPPVGSAPSRQQQGDAVRKFSTDQRADLCLAILVDSGGVVVWLVPGAESPQSPLIGSKIMPMPAEASMAAEAVISSALYLAGHYREALVRIESLAFQVEDLSRPYLSFFAGNAAVQDFRALASYVSNPRDEWGTRARGVQCYRSALSEWSAQREPLEWAAAMNNLGWTLEQAGTFSGLQESVECCRLAAEVFRDHGWFPEMQVATANLRDSQRRLAELEKESRPIMGELSQARAQVRQLLQLPEGPVKFPGVAVAHRLKQATTLSGDFYNLISRSDGALAIYMVDVEGHGLVASSQAQAVHQVLSRDDLEWGYRGTPQEELETADTLVTRELGSAGIAVTMNFTVIDAGRTTLRHASAGMPAPLLFRAGQSEPENVRAAGAYVGGGYTSFGTGPRSAESAIRSGDLLVLYSDGITEARDPQDRLFGTNGIIAAVARTRCESAESIADEILQATARHSQASDPQDDQTLLVVQIAEA